MHLAVACQQTHVTSGSAWGRSRLSDNGAPVAAQRAAISLDGEGDVVLVLVTMPQRGADVALCVGAKQECLRDDAPLMNLIDVNGANDGTSYGASYGAVTFRSEQAVNLANGLEMHVVSRQIPRQVIRSVRLQNKNPAANANGWLSLGSGGQTGSYEETFEFKGNTAKYRVSVQDDVQTGRYGMLVYLHGDGAWDYEGFWRDSKAIAFRHDLIAVHVQAPTTGNAGRSWWIAGDSNAEYLNALLQERVLRLYNIDRSKVIFSGQSGGPTFMTGTWMNRYMQQFLGGAVFMCGGMLYSNSGMEASSDWRHYFKIRIETTTGDFLNGGAQNARQRYERYGMDVRLTTHGEGSHCKFDENPATILDQRVAEILQAR